ncbi:MAG TPA: hypothetical protein VKZ74_07445, partial [Natronosporangium sp.]|nr:hypothetical protein [Natronosporangium sp.]
MSNRTRMALGLAGGYLLGRRRKAGWLLAAVGLVASRGLGAAVSRRGTAALDSSPELKELTEQARRTAMALMGGRVEQLTNRIRATTETLRSATPGAPSKAEPEQPEAE